jgi:hypothetical protein
MVWVSVPAEKNDFLSAMPSWAVAAAASTSANALSQLTPPVDTSYREPPAAFPIDSDVMNLTTNPDLIVTTNPDLIVTAKPPLMVTTEPALIVTTNPALIVTTSPSLTVTTTTLQLMGSQTIEYNDAASRVKLIMVKENVVASTSAAANNDRALRPYAAALRAASPFAAAVDSGRASGCRSPLFPFPTSPRAIKQEMGRSSGPQGSITAKLADVAVAAEVAEVAIEKREGRQEKRDEHKITGKL